MHVYSAVAVLSRRCLSTLIAPQQTLAVDPMFIRCWASVVGGGLTSNQRWVLCLLRQDSVFGGLGGGGGSYQTQQGAL